MRLTQAVFVTLVLTGVLTAADLAGNWKLNAERSKLPADLASETMTITQTGPKSYKTKIDMVMKSGEKRHAELNRTYDGQEHVLKGVELREETGASEICQQVDQLTRKVTAKRDGKIIEEVTSTLSEDGKVVTVRIHGIVGNTEEVLVFDRQ